MRYLLAVGLPTLLQCLFIFIVIEMNTGNGSWVGLGAFLVGMFAVPATAAINFFMVRAQKSMGIIELTFRAFTISLITPILVIMMLALG